MVLCAVGEGAEDFGAVECRMLVALGIALVVSYVANGTVVVMVVADGTAVAVAEFAFVLKLEASSFGSCGLQFLAPTPD